jgi:SAM-dependent methyltransferase
MSEFERFSPNSVWGSPFDVRFYLASKIKTIKQALVLDVGCGPGILLSERNHRTVFGIGIDISTECLRTSKNVDDSLQGIASDMHYLPFKDEAFDYVIIANSFSRFDTKVDENAYPDAPHTMLMGEASRVLRWNGKLLMTTPNGSHRYYRHKKKVDYQTLEASLQKYFDFKISGYNPLPVSWPSILDVRPLSSLYLMLLQLLMKVPYSRYYGMFFFVEGTKKNSNDHFSPQKILREGSYCQRTRRQST